MLRVDLLGERYMFYGLEPSPEQDGWLLIVGPDAMYDERGSDGGSIIVSYA
jgi:hypothetical protein